MSRVQFEWARDARLGKAVHITNAHHESGRWICLGCNWELVAKQGQIKAWHFAHKTESKCSGGGRGGESNEHEAAKLIIKETLPKWTFIGQPCLVCAVPAIESFSFAEEFDDEATWEVKEEVKIGDYRVDVGVLRNGKLWGAVEIWHKHKVELEKWLFLHKTLDGIVYEVKADEVLSNHANSKFVVQDQKMPNFVCDRCEHKKEEQRRQALLKEEHDKMLREEYHKRQEAERAEEDRRRREQTLRLLEEMETEKAKAEAAAAEKLRIENEKAAERLRMIQEESARRAQAEREEAKMRAEFLAVTAREDMKHMGYVGKVKNSGGIRAKVTPQAAPGALGMQKQLPLSIDTTKSVYASRARSIPKQAMLVFKKVD